MSKRALLFYVVALCCLSALSLLTPLVSAQTATPIGVTGVPTQYYIITLTPSVTPGCPAPQGFHAGDRAVVAGGMYIRTGPGGTYPYVGYVAEATRVTITDGPVCDNANSTNWWKVSGALPDGWVAEGSPQKYYVYPGSPEPITVCNAPQSLTIGKPATLAQAMRVRETAGLHGRVVTVAPKDAVVAVLQGPECHDNYQWWLVEVTVLDVVYRGWMADASDGGISFWEIAPPQCDNPDPLVIGGVAYVDDPDNALRNLRAEASSDSELVASLLPGLAVTVLEGPVCAGGYNWWRIQVKTRPDVSGWMADGAGKEHWLVPFHPTIKPV